MVPRALVDELRATLVAAIVCARASPSEGCTARDASNISGAAGVVCFPESTAEVQACVRAAARHATAFVARGSGTGLAGGAVPLDDAVVISTMKMNRIVSVDGEARQAWVEPGVLNLDLTTAP